MPKTLWLSGDMVTVSMKNKPLRQQIFLFFFAFNLFLLALLWSLQTIFLSDTYEMIREKEVREAIRLVGRHINSPDLPVILKELEKSKNIVVQVSKDFEIPYLLEDYFQLDPGPKILKEDHIYTLKDGSQISLTFYALLSPVDATISTLRYQLTLVSIIMLILSSLAAFYLSKMIARPIVQLNQEAKKLSKGFYQASFQESGYQEIQELSDTLTTASKDLALLDQDRRELLANVSHDLRTPLALIYSQAELIHDFPQEVTPDQSQIILREVTRLSKLVSDLLNKSALEAGRLPLDLSNYNLSQAIRDAIHQLQALDPSRNLRFSFHCDQDACLEADENKINQVLYNLLVNAMAHSPQGGLIQITQKLEKDRVLLSIKDQGPGIREEDLPYIWDRYYKLDKNFSSNIPSTGLGLSIVKKIVLLHHGRVYVSSTGKSGSTFSLDLPLKQA